MCRSKAPKRAPPPTTVSDRQQQRVAQALQREDLARELGQAQQAQQPQQAQDAQALQAGGQDRRGEEDDDDVERVVADARPSGRGRPTSITTSSTRKAVQVIQLRTIATFSRAPPGWDSVIATVGRVSAAAISIGVLRRSATRVLRASIPGA